MKIKKSLENNISKTKLPFAKVFVSDQSFALINSMLETFNNCSLIHYLEWCFDLTIKKNMKTFHNTSMPILAYLCASHFLKNIISQTNVLLNLKKRYSKLDRSAVNNLKIKQFFVCAFTLLQNSINIQDFNDTLADIFIIFNSITRSASFIQSFDRITNKIYIRDNSVLFDLSKEDEDNLKNINEFKIISREVKADIKKNSPFNKYYENFLNGLQNSIELNSEPLCEKNEMFFPELLNLIRKKLYIMPLWSGVVVFRNGPIGNYESHITNNPAEVSFFHKRYSVLQISKKGKQ